MARLTDDEVTRSDTSPSVTSHRDALRSGDTSDKPSIEGLSHVTRGGSGLTEARQRLPLTEVQKIEQALDQLLRAAIDADREQRAKTRSEPLRVSGLPAELPDPVQARAEEIIANPLGAAMRYAVRDLGKRLFGIGGLDLMSEVCQRVADLDASNWSRRTSIMDSRWNGIGSAQGGWWVS